MDVNNIITGVHRELKPYQIYNKNKRRLMSSSVILPSQYNAYSICTEFMKNWFLDKFKPKFFNSVYVEGKHSFDEFRQFSSIDEQLKKVNPILAIVPSISPEHNRDWIDSSPEIPFLMRRTMAQGIFFKHYYDNNNSIQMQISFKTILMNFTFKTRVNTRAEQLDLFEIIKVKHRAGLTESHDVSLDIHVPNQIILQVASDNGFKIDDKGRVEKPHELLKYLNKHSIVPFLFKFRAATGNYEFFIKIPNCVVHIKSEMPSIDDGERQGFNSTNYSIDFNVSVEMSAPYAYVYYSQNEQSFIKSDTVDDDAICIVKSQIIKTDIPNLDEHKWELFSTTEYLIEQEDLHTNFVIDFNDYFESTQLKDIIQYTKNIAINPGVFLNFKFFNDSVELSYEIDWETMKCKVLGNINELTTVIAIYCDMEYVNNTVKYLEHIGESRIN